MVVATFIGTSNTPIYNPPAEMTQKLPDKVLDQTEAERLREKGSDGKPLAPGANRRAGVATRNPDNFDAHQRAHGAHGDTKPVKEPVL
ncbi:hypothetical protein EWM64_g10865 [Hericium alpestre]|uniref:Uncharacterized protein n=1 Tax=Hericium alpestre TaxID=135208 RepID=A0A4Y9ZGI5_9AGAM|nr:hypothetical protein EWM64_g10865 [Hericium alpestre]